MRLIAVTESDALMEGLDVLSGSMSLRRCHTPQEAYALLLAEGGQILLLDCPEDDGAMCALSRWTELNRPDTECMALVYPKSYCAMGMTRSQNYASLLKPVPPAQLVTTLSWTRHKLEMMSVFGGAERINRDRRERQFWLYILHGNMPVENLLPNVTEPPALFYDSLEHRILPVLLCFRGFLTHHNAQEQDMLRLGIKALTEKRLTERYGGIAMSWVPNTLLVLIYGGDLPDETTTETLCADLSRRCGEDFDCSVACYCGEPVAVSGLRRQVDLLLAGDRNNVLRDSGTFSLRQISAPKQPLSTPAPQNWMMYFTQGQFEEFYHCVSNFLEKATAANVLDRDFLVEFQHDLIQELGFALKETGVPARKLLGGYAATEDMLEATRSVPAMLAWIRKTAARAMELAGCRSETLTVARQVQNYIQLNIEKPFSRQELAEVLHLSPGHIARAFRRETGKTIAAYINEQRLDMCRHLLTQTDLPPTVIAQRAGYHDYPYFYKTFKQDTGFSPTEYREEMRE